MSQKRCSKVRHERDDPALILACQAGDEGAWKALIARYRRLIYSVPVTAYRMASQEADEVFQNVVVRLFENLGRLRSAENLRAWLLTVARNECRNRLRRIQRFPLVDEREAHTVAEDPPDVIDKLHQVDCEHRLARAFEMLDSRSRELLAAFFLEEPEPSYARVACRLGRPIGSLGPTRARCLDKLRRIYLDLDGGTGHAETLPAWSLPQPAAHLEPTGAAAV